MSDKDPKDSESNEESGSERKRWSEMMREMALSGLATFFMTEDTVRSYLKDMKLPKELVALLMDGASKKKDDFYGLMVKEFGKVLAKVDISREVGKFLENHRISVEAKVSFEPKATALEADKEERKGS